MDVTLKVNGKEVAQGRVPAAMLLHFTSNATFDIGTEIFQVRYLTPSFLVLNGKFYRIE